jgi:RNA polymerase sigma factor (TIGR02999 family)
VALVGRGEDNLARRSMSEVTLLLDALRDGGGDRRAADRLLEAVYAELRSLAARKLAGEAPGQTLQATELVHEAWLRLAGAEQRDWRSRAYFFGAAAEAMRRILVERARRKRSLRGGGALEREELAESRLALPGEELDLVALDEALGKLAREDPAKAKLVELRYFAGLTLEAAAEALGLSRATAERRWAYARAFLWAEVRKGDSRP